MRKTTFANQEYYHIYNRGTDKREVFSDEKDYGRFLRSLREFNNESLHEERIFLKNKARREKPGLSPDSSGLSPGFSPNTSKLVEIICYCLNPNHYHLILKQAQEGGISKFMLKVGTGYTTYFNQKNDRSGSLFQGPFKSIHIDTNEYLLYLSAYVNANHFIHGYENSRLSERLSPDSSGLSLDMEAWSYSSLPDYLKKRNGTLCQKDPILGQFKNTEEYAKFIKDNAIYLKEKKEMEKYVLE